MTIIELALKASILMATAGIVAAVMQRRASAASRHLIWTLAMAGVFVLPAASVMMPAWNIPVREAVKVVQAPARPDEMGTGPAMGAGSLVAVPGERPFPTPWLGLLSWLPAVYGAGLLLLLSRLGYEHIRMRRLLARTSAATDPRWLALLYDCATRAGVTRPVELGLSGEPAMPMVCGILRPHIVLPAVAESWEEGRRRAVLLHELAHVARYDCLTQLLAEAVVALYWPHPGVWWMARKLRVERELACDDAVLLSGTEPREYAGHLLEIAHTLGRFETPALVLPMARPRQLESRMLAMLDATRRRSAPGRRRGSLALAASVLLVGALSAAAPATVPAATPARGQAGDAGAARADRGTAVQPGTWQIRLSADGRTADLIVSPSEHSSHSWTVAVERIEGLASVAAGPGGPVRLATTRDAGTFAFEGVIRSGAGGGVFLFAPSATFPVALTKRGFARPTPAELEALAWGDIGLAFVDELAVQKYARPTLAQLVNAAYHGVGITYVRDLAGLGYHLGTIDALARLRDHGVSAEYIRSLQALGLTGLTGEDLVRARDHGVGPEFVGGMQRLGYTSMTLDDLVASRDHGLGPEYIDQIAAVGYRNPSIPQLIQMRDHGITPEYIREVQKRSGSPSIQQLISLHDRGLTEEPSQPLDYRIKRLHQSGGLMSSVHAVLRDFWLRWTSGVNPPN